METIRTRTCCRATNCVFCLVVVIAEVKDAIVAKVEGARKTLHRWFDVIWEVGLQGCMAHARGLGGVHGAGDVLIFFHELGAGCAMREGAYIIRLDLFTT